MQAHPEQDRVQVKAMALESGPKHPDAEAFDRRYLQQAHHIVWVWKDDPLLQQQLDAAGLKTPVHNFVDLGKATGKIRTIIEQRVGWEEDLLKILENKE